MITRRWWKGGRPAPIEAGSGFALDHADARTLGDLASALCVVLVGDSGLGKSRAVDDERKRLRAANQHATVHILRAARDMDEVRGWLKEALAKAQDGRPAHLFLDGLDEVVGSMRYFVAQLTDTLLSNEDALPHLRLRIVCRTNALPLSLSETLARAYGGSEVETWTLLPLARNEVSAVARALDPGVDVVTLEQLQLPRIAPLTSRPLALKLLLSSYRDPHSHSTAVGPYMAAVASLARDPDRDRQAQAMLDVPRRIALAQRVAVICVLGERHRIELESAAIITPGVLTLDELRRVASPEDLRELVTHTQLFADGEFFHRSVAEWLAAEQLAPGDPDVVVARLFEPGLEGGRVVPQLRGLALLLAKRRRFFVKIVARDPFTLLDLDPTDVEDDQRELLFEAVFRYREDPQTIAWAHQIAERLSALAPRSVAALLEAAIRDVTRSLRRRGLAIETASRCRCHSIVDLCVDIALAPGDAHLRAEAAWAVASLGSDKQKALLHPLVDQTDDPDDQLRGIALEALWPGQLSTDAMLTALTPHRNPRFVGRYSQFVWSVVPARLRRSDIAPVLRWCVRNSDILESWSQSTLVERLVALAVENIEVPDVAMAMREFIAARREHHPSPLCDVKRVIDALPFDQRERLRRAIVTLALEAEDSWDLAVLVETTDVDWVFARAVGGVGSSEELAWIQLATQVYWQREAFAPALTESLLGLAETSTVPEAQKRLAEMRKPMWLDDETTRRTRESALRSKRFDADFVRATQARRAAIDEAVERATGGDIEGFWLAVYSINGRVRRDGSIEQWRSGCLSQSDWWTEADTPTRLGFLGCARQYLSLGDPQKESWFGRNVVHWPATAGRLALILLHEVASHGWDELGVEVIERWTPTLLFPELITEEASREDADALLLRAYRAAPDAYRRDALVLLRRECEEGDYPSSLRSIAPVCDATWWDGLFDLARLPTLTPDAYRQLLPLLAGIDWNATMRMVNSDLDQGWNAPDLGGRCAEEAAAYLLRTDPNHAWPRLAMRFDAEPARGARVVHRVDNLSPRSDRDRGPPFSDAALLADFYRWARRALGVLTDPPRAAHRAEVTDRVALDWMLPGVRARLASLASPEAIDALARLRADLPDDGSLPFAQEDARERFLQRRWCGWPVPELVTAFCA